VSKPSEQPVTVQFGSSQRYDFTVADEAGNLRWRWAADRTFAQVLGAEHVGLHATLAYHEQYSDRLAPGTYRATGILVASPDPLAASVALTIERR
jgi:hypothetical protein